MHSTVTLVFAVAAIVLVQCQPNWVTQYKDVRAQVMPTFVEGRTARAFLPPRYRNLFGEESSKVREEAFAPQTISDITGKVNQQRRQLFSWQPNANADFFRR
ncbi:hypothetical protein Y032_0030g2023 [Ancylostoma ceylanicum]|uniref:Uncharacterized protein n=1 Tax=Ancylostoma ceylanicum TaxID=53326 RepID=A0A016USD6_9BILA|nr:hypothetical protein Y032_0030g2023 [Ancylostoma ceylanicum]